MAKKFSSKVNVEEGKFAILDEGAYTDITDLSGLQTSEYAPVVANASLYGDGAKLDEINEITSATLTDVSAGEPIENIAILSGQDGAGGEFSEGSGDSPPVVGRSYIATLRKGGVGQTTVTGYVAYFCPAVKYAPVTDSLTAKTDGVTYSTTSLVGTCFPDDSGKFRYRKEFTGATPLDDARAWVSDKFGEE